jgi:hypothetical protein
MRLDFDDKTGRPIMRLHGVLRNVERTYALLLFLKLLEPASGHAPWPPSADHQAMPIVVLLAASGR